MKGQIDYPDHRKVIERMKEEVDAVLGEGAWEDMGRSGSVPNGEMDDAALSGATRELLKQFDARTVWKERNDAFCNVRHGLTPTHLSWVRDLFLEYGSIDSFCDALRRENREGFHKALETGGSFHGQPVDQSVVDFFEDHPYLLYGARVGNRIHATAIPRQTRDYIAESDPKRKRYLACHCQFARESILSADGPVSKTLCYCSLGHTMIFWETALDTKLTGGVEESALGGGLLCRFVIDLPDSVMERYT